MTEEDRTTMRVTLCKPDEKAVVIVMEDIGIQFEDD